MAYLRKKNETPPGSWQFHQKETDLMIKGENLGQLVDLVIRHRQYKSLQPQDRATVQLDIERQICTKLGTSECRSEGVADPWKPQNPEITRVTMGMMISFSKAALAFVKSGGELATMEEAQRRAAICKACPLAIPMTGCACGSFVQVIEASIPRERRLMDNKICAACSCSLSAKVNLTEEQVRYSNEGRKDIVWPEGVNCWQLAIEQKAKT